MNSQEASSSFGCVYEICDNKADDNGLYCEFHQKEVCLEVNCSRKPETCINVFYNPVYCTIHRRCYNNTCPVKVSLPDYFCEDHYPGNQEAHPNFDTFLNDWGTQTIIISDDSNDSTITHANDSSNNDEHMKSVYPISEEIIQSPNITPKRKKKMSLISDKAVKSSNITPKKKKKTIEQSLNITPKRKKTILIDPIKQKHKEAKKPIKKIKKILNSNVETFLMSRKKDNIPIEPKVQWYKEARKKHLNL